MKKYEWKQRSFGHFATSCCSTLGGVFTVVGIIAVFLNTSWEPLQVYKKNLISEIIHENSHQYLNSHHNRNTNNKEGVNWLANVVVYEYVLNEMNECLQFEL
uniref:Uncharacterized protein n=1 Tax=Glossina brevipalpis TaxID=37001 RepID=A0A1A9X124_9MUSC